MKISIVTVCRNDLKGVKGTFESIRAQDCADLEWWVIDGNSKDGTVAWLQENHRLEGAWLSEPDHGIYDAMNKGIGHATGDYLLFMNSGDKLADPEVIAKLQDRIKAQKTFPDFVYGDAVDVGINGVARYRKAWPLRHIKVGMITRHQSMLFRREAILNLGYPLNYPLSADYALTASLLMKKDTTILHVDFPVCRFSMGGEHHSRRVEALKEDFWIRREILQENFVLCVFLFLVHWLHHCARKLARS